MAEKGVKVETHKFSKIFKIIFSRTFWSVPKCSTSETSNFRVALPSIEEISVQISIFNGRLEADIDCASYERLNSVLISFDNSENIR